MSPGVEDLQMLRLIRAFQKKLIDQDARRSVLNFVDEQLEKQDARTTEKLGRTEH